MGLRWESKRSSSCGGLTMKIVDKREDHWQVGDVVKSNDGTVGLWSNYYLRSLIEDK